MATFTGKLGQNKVLFSEVAGALYNMILNQTVESRTIGRGMATLLDEATRDVGLYGDRILKYFTDMLKVYDYDPDSTDQLNVLKTYRPKPPICQEMVIDTAKFIPLTLDNYLTKQGFSDEATFGQFNDVMRSWLQNTKRVYLAKKYNVFIGTAYTEVGKQSVAITEVAGGDTNVEKEAAARINGQTIAKTVADIVVSMTEDANRDYNDLGLEACFDKEDILMIWNAEKLNEITLMDLPTMYDSNEVLATLKQNIRRLPGKYFGTQVPADVKTALTADGTNYRFVEQTDVAGKTYMPGDLIPNGTVIRTAAGVIQVPAYANEAKEGANDCLVKIVHKDAAPVLAGFETTTEFWNPSNLSTNDYLHFLFNSFDRFTGYPWVTVYLA